MHSTTLSFFAILATLSSSAAAQVPGACALEDAAFQTLDGGCKDLTSGLIWSADYFQVYQSSGASVLTFSAATDYAQNLVEGGFDDWRLPTQAELLDLHANGGAAHLNLPDPLFYHWSSTKSGRQRYIVNIASGDSFSVNRTSTMMVICVREVSSGGGGNGNGGGRPGGGNGNNNRVAGPAAIGQAPQGVRFVRGGLVHVHLTAPEHADRAFVVAASSAPATASVLPSIDAWLGATNGLSLVAPGKFDPSGRAHMAFERTSLDRLAADGVDVRLGVLVLDPEADRRAIVDAFLVHRQPSGRPR